MTLATDGTRIYEFDHLMTGERELYAHEGGLFILYDHGKKHQVAIDPIGMTKDEIERSVIAADEVLARVPVNRAQRRAMN